MIGRYHGGGASKTIFVGLPASFDLGNQRWFEANYGDLKDLGEGRREQKITASVSSIDAPRDLGIFSSRGQRNRRPGSNDRSVAYEIG
jgi:hypothetical protein